MPRYSLTGLFIGVAIIAAACAALAQPTELAVQLVVTAALLTLMLLAIVMFSCRGAARSFAAGMAMTWFIYCWSIGSFYELFRYRDSYNRHLLTTRAVEQLFDAMHEEDLATIEASRRQLILGQPLTDDSTVTLPNGSSYFWDAARENWTTSEGHRLFRKEEFSVIAHTLWGALLGLGGGGLAVWFDRRRGRQSRQESTA